MPAYRWATLGCGVIGNELAQAMQALGGNLYSVGNRTHEKAQAFAEKYGIAKVYDKPEDIFSDPDVDIVYISTPHNTHIRYLLPALAAGKHVLCEKSITLNSRELDQARRCADEHGVVLAEAMTLYHMPIYKQLADLIHSGALGPLRFIQMNFGSYKEYDMNNRFFNRSLAGGALLDIGIYALSFVRYFMSCQPDQIASQVRLAPTGVDEQAGILLQNREGEMATLSLSLHAKQPKRGMAAFDKGYIEIYDYPRADTATITYTADGHPPAVGPDLSRRRGGSAMSYLSIDTFWILMAAVLVFFMQPGFAMLEAGLTRGKNAGNIVMKNFMNFSLGTLAFWIVGFSLLFGRDIGGFIGMPDFFAQHMDLMAGTPYPDLAFLLFQTVLCAVTAAIVSGAMAERTKFSSSCLITILISLLIYPIVGHWSWGGGWLAALGFHDFAGASVVSLTGGICALTGAKALGPRIGKYNDDGSVNAIPGHSLPLACLGMFILWFGWFGFNGGQTLSLTGEQTILKAASIFFTTNIAAAAGTTTAMVTTWIRYGKPDVSMTLDGSLAALVAITAGCDVVSVPGAFVIGALAGIVTVFLIEFIDQKLRIDDPVGAIAAHGGCGALGTLLTGLFSVQDGLFYTGEIRLFLVQLAGIVAMGLFVFVAMTLIFRILQATVGLRVSAAEEINGLDFKENGLVPAYELDRSDDLEDLSQALKAGEAPEGAQEIPLDQAIPDSVMASPQPVGGHALYNVTIITDEKRFETLKDAMEAIGITGMTITRALGFGIEKGRTEFYRGAKVSAKLLPKVRVEMVVSKVSPRTIIETAKKVLYTGNYGDGKVFVSAIDNAVKIRTGEEGYDALQDYPVVQKK